MVSISRAVMSLEDEIDQEERLALSEQAIADRLRAQSAEMASHAEARLRAVVAARVALTGERLPVLEPHDEPDCRESLAPW